MAESIDTSAEHDGVRVYFLSDLHLGAPYFPDSRERELRVVRFLDSIKEKATHIYLLGDILDYWYEYRHVVPRGYVRFFGKLAELSDKGIKITWLIGNHDIWIFDYIPSELGVRVADGVLNEKIGNHEFVLTHGDGVGDVPVPFRYLRRLFRSRVCQWMFAAIHPRWTVPFAYAWSGHSRAHGMPPDAMSHPMVENLNRYSAEHNAAHPSVAHYIYGHLHIVSSLPVGEKARQWILGDWLYNMSYAVYDGKEVKMYRRREDGSDCEICFDKSSGVPKT